MRVSLTTIAILAVILSTALLLLFYMNARSTSIRRRNRTMDDLDDANEAGGLFDLWSKGSDEEDADDEGDNENNGHKKLKKKHMDDSDNNDDDDDDDDDDADDDDDNENEYFDAPYIPDWVKRYRVASFFDWTWHKNGEYDTFLRKLKTLTPSSHFQSSSNVVTDALAYLPQHADVGVIVDDFAQLPNPVPHPLPRHPDFRQACSDLHIGHEWLACKMDATRLATAMPYTNKFVAIGVYNGFVDYGSCHPLVPGTIFSNAATFHFQRWTNNDCHTGPIRDIRNIDTTYSNEMVADPLGTYLSAFGHYPNQQFPRFLRLLAVIPNTTKIVTPTDGIVAALFDILVDRGVLDRSRLIPFAGRTVHAKVVFRSEAYPYLSGEKYGHYLHDRTDMEMTHRIMVDDVENDAERNLIVVVKREGGSRSISNHDAVVAKIEQLKPPHLTVELFLAHGHLRDHINMFKRARVVLAPHGTGLINVMWCKKGTDIVEVGYSGGMTLPSMYYEMSVHSGHDYWLVRGNGHYETPMQADMNDVEWVLKGIFEKHKHK